MIKIFHASSVQALEDQLNELEQYKVDGKAVRIRDVKFAVDSAQPFPDITSYNFNYYALVIYDIAPIDKEGHSGSYGFN